MRLVEGGASLIQLREKHASPSDFYRDAKRALAFARQHNCHLIINDRLDIAFALGADGVHLGQGDMPVQAARRILGESGLIGFSTHNLSQAEKALSLPIDYVAFGPVFETGTKKDHEPIVGLEQLNAVRGVLGSSQLVAIGGITLENVQQVLAAGSDSVAVISAILSDPAKISENFARMLACAER